jgi:hypothetical protein
MIYEYALEPEMVATWGNPRDLRFFIRAFGPDQGRIVSRYPKKWVKKVWESAPNISDMERKRLEEFLARIKDSMIKRKACCWNDSEKSWLKNVLNEHHRYPFRAIIIKSDTKKQPPILTEEMLSIPPCLTWDSPHGITISRDAKEMATAVQMMLSCCRWVKFIDPHISPGTKRYRISLCAFLNILAAARPVGPPEAIEIHTKQHEGTENFLRNAYREIIPPGLTLTVYQWKKRIAGPKLHNRYILTDIGGVSFHHGLDTGEDGETDDISRLDSAQYQRHCKQYDKASTAFEPAAPPLTIVG